MVVKYETKNLKCFLCKDGKGQLHHQIFEKGNDIPIIIYVDRHTMHLSDRFPLVASEYKFYDEVREIIKLLVDMEG